jgi:hypothetical protein
MINPLIPILKDCWVKIQKIYNDGKICSERHLQAEIFSILSHDDRFNNFFQVFIEPRLFSEDDKAKNIGIIGIIKGDLLLMSDCLSLILSLPGRIQMLLRSLMKFLKESKLITNPLKTTYILRE